MEHELKVKYLKITMAMASVGIDEMTADLIVSCYEKILKKGGATNLHDVCAIESDIQKRAVVRNTQKNLDKVSEKTD